MINVSFSKDVENDVAEKIKGNLNQIKDGNGYSVIGDVSKVVEEEKMRISSLEFRNGKIDLEVEASYEAIS